MICAVDLVNSVGPLIFQLIVPGSVRHEVHDLFLAEPHRDATCDRGDLVLGVALSDLEASLKLARECADRGAAGLVLRLPLAAHPDLRVLAEEAELPLIGLHEGASWTHVIWILRSVIDRAAGPDGSFGSDDGVHGDLFRLADAAAQIIDAPVTIEDNQSRVLAYSSGQDATDEARVSTIVGRRVPPAVHAHYRARGVFRRLATSSEPIYVPEGPDGTLPRLIVPVQVHGQWLGSIWAVVHGPVPEEKLAPMQDAASVLALHLLRLRAQADVAQRGWSERLRSALREFVPTLQIVLPPPPWRVVAFMSDPTQDIDERLDLLTLVLRRHGWREPIVCSLEGMLYAVVRAETEFTGSWAWLRSVATGDDGALLPPPAAGGRAAELAELPGSRAQALELSSLIATGTVRGPARDFESSWAAVTIARAISGTPIGPLQTPVQDLHQHDLDKGTDYVTTLGAWLTHPAEPKRAARMLHLHPNTLRHRMGRIMEQFALDLTDADERLALLLHVRCLRAATRPK